MDYEILLKPSVVILDEDIPEDRGESNDSAMLEGMGSRHEETQSVDVTGLSEEAVRAVESLVAALREQANGSSAYPSPEEWCKALREWAERHRRLDNPADWSRDAVYAGRGE